MAGFVAMTLSSADGNGGGYSLGSATTGSLTGFSPSGTEDVGILDEQLTVRLRPFEADVDVRYILKNGDRPANVRFGFPIEELGEGSDLVPTVATLRWEKPKYCRDYSVEVSGKPVSFRFEAEPDSAKEEDRRRVGLRGWLVSKVSFAAGEEKIMRIRYRSDYVYSTFSVNMDRSTSPKEFHYRLSTGACWRGPIAKGRVVIEPEGIDSRDVIVYRPVNRFKKEGSKWVWEFENLEPTLADDITVQAEPSSSVEFRDKEKIIERDNIWYVAHTNYIAKASSTLPPSHARSYDVAGLRDDSLDTVWSEGVPGPGIGEWIEITPEVAQPLRAIEINPGYAEDGKLFLANARPKKLEVLINGSRRFAAHLADRRELQRIPIEGFDKPVKSIRLTVADVYPGSKFEDLCITGIRLEAKLKKQPKIEPIR